jgi:hypothetical protein
VRLKAALPMGVLTARRGFYCASKGGKDAGKYGAQRAEMRTFEIQKHNYYYALYTIFLAFGPHRLRKRA